MKRISIHWTAAALALVGILAAACAVSLCVGSADIPLSRIFPAILGGGTAIENAILRDVRLPRILLGVAVGGSLSIAGVILQGMFRNPLVEPYTMGISGGAALGVCLAIVARLSISFGALSLPLAGFAGAISSLAVVYSLSARRRVMSIRDILLIGVMISFVCSSLITLIMAVSRVEDLHGIIFWIMGSLEQPNVFLVWLAVALSATALGVAYLFCKDLNAMSLGDEEALHLGINVENSKRLLFVLASVTTGLSVSVAGVIGFVGLVVPHFARLTVGEDHRILLAVSWLCGATFLVLCDALARTIISPMELPVGVITGILGGGIFIYMLCKRPAMLGK